jgi:large subunit ribosomal protein L7/L12
MALSIDEIIENIKSLTVIELHDLSQKLKEVFNISEAAYVTAAAAPGAASANAQEEEKTEFSAELTEVGAEKIKVIKVVREITGLGLKEAKDIVVGAPKILKDGLSKEEAESIKTKLEAVGAKVSLK